MNKASTLYILLGLFLAGGVYSFWRQKLSKSLITLVAVGSAMSLVAGVMRL